MAKNTQDEEWEGGIDAAPTIVEFDVLGDVFRGILKGVEVITDPNNGKEWNQWLFTGIFPDELAGEHCAVRGTFELDKKMPDIPEGYEVQLTYVKDVPTSKGNPMKSFDLRWRKAQHSRVSAT